MTPPHAQLSPAEGWRTPGYRRVQPMTSKESSLWQRMLSFLITKVFKVRAPNLFLTGLRNSRVFLPMLIYNQQMMPRGELERCYTELAILRVAWLSRCHYEWGQHVEIGLRNGLTPEDIRRVTQGADAAGWSATQAALIQAVDELHHDKIIGRDTWNELRVGFSERELIELLLVINHYSGLAGVLNSLGIELDTPIAKLLAETPIHPSNKFA